MLSGARWQCKAVLGHHGETLLASGVAAKGRNTGPTGPAGTVPLLFEPLRRLTERTHAAGEGARLGLSLVDSIARAHDATATADPNEDGGA
ncbi:hypothetical protein ACFY13_51220 [Streptomyces mirabilis]|uniref:hypothetical protein n=1 Tax=Streptomyces mirabilis TaxID=68239 RepID=UPI00365CBC45